MSRVRWVGSRQIQREAETFEVLPHVLQVGIAVIKDTMGRELGLDEHLKGRAHSEDDDLSRFGVKFKLLTGISSLPVNDSRRVLKNPPLRSVST